MLVDGEVVERFPAAPVIDIRCLGSLAGEQRCCVQVGPHGEEATATFLHRGPLHVDLRRI